MPNEKEEVHFKLRMPIQEYEFLKSQSEANNRSRNNQLVTWIMEKRKEVEGNHLVSK